MRIEYVGRGYQAGSELKTFAEDRLAKAVRFLEAPVEVKVAFVLERHLHRADVHVLHRYGAFQAQEETSDMREAVALAADKVEAQAKRVRKRYMDRRRRAARSAEDQAHWPVDVVERSSLGAASNGGVRIIKSSLLRIKPMTIDEAAIHLETSENGFVVFRDATSDRVSVLYRRKDEHYGLIAPEF